MIVEQKFKSYQQDYTSRKVSCRIKNQIVEEIFSEGAGLNLANVTEISTFPLHNTVSWVQDVALTDHSNTKHKNIYPMGNINNGIKL